MRFCFSWKFTSCVSDQVVKFCCSRVSESRHHAEEERWKDGKHDGGGATPVPGAAEARWGGDAEEQGRYARSVSEGLLQTATGLRARRHNQNHVIMIIGGLWRYSDWRHVATGCNAVVTTGNLKGRKTLWNNIFLVQRLGLGYRPTVVFRSRHVTTGSEGSGRRSYEQLLGWQMFLEKKHLECVCFPR